MPSFGRRRTWTFVLVGFALFFVLSRLRNLRHGGPDTFAFGAPDPDPAANDKGTGYYHHPPSRWTSLKLHYQVPSMRQFPKGPPLALPKVQKSFDPESPSDREVRLRRQAAVKKAFLRCWDSYRANAWLSDELAPVTGGKRDLFGGWGATLVDSLDTLWIMGLRSQFDEAVTAAANISFETTSLHEISVFETNIRYLGGFLAAYDLSGDKRLLQKAREVGEMLYIAFDTPNRMPVARWNPHTASRGQYQTAQDSVLLAEIGSFSLEFIRLSLLTGDPKWFDAVQRIMEEFEKQQQTTHLPGMWPVVVNARTQSFNKHSDYTLGAMADSMYEYLPKTHALVGGLLPMYRDMYEAAMDTAIRYNLFRPMVPDEKDILMSGMVSTTTESGKIVATLRPEAQHLACFIGGMFALGGKLIQNQTHVDKGEKLTDGCVWAYQASPLGIMPEVFRMVPCKSADDCPWNEEEWMKAIVKMAGQNTEKLDVARAEALIAQKRLPKGFTNVQDTRYILRPEAIESVFILYRITGRPDLLESAWTMFEAIDSNTRTDLANSAMGDVMAADGKPSDSMESFWLGETLKYFYLVFSEPDLIDLDEYVFNTEAHPFKRLLPPS
ncbi:glycoside hydrolase family 47 protein [Cercophora scortea]|uniref:alpha-1,2-Mannosidase n=1 Tax=Cercophora scortea TaxID=314031 RepID=A0AAE0IPF5_9PEZI|nr:glycoside hydrolase family 47 protein [Cercophora scortea]